MELIWFKIALVLTVIAMWILCGLWFHEIFFCNTYFDFTEFFLGFSMFDLKEGLERHRIARANSHVGEYLLYEDLAFRRLNYRIQMVVHGVVDYR